MIRNLHYVKELGCEAKRRWRAATCALRRADARALGAQEAALQRHDAIRRSTNGTIWRGRMARMGGKLIGAGGGGFLMFYAEDPTAAACTRCRRQVSRRSASASTSKARSICSREPAGGDPVDVALPCEGASSMQSRARSPPSGCSANGWEWTTRPSFATSTSARLMKSSWNWGVCSTSAPNPSFRLVFQSPH